MKGISKLCPFLSASSGVTCRGKGRGLKGEATSKADSAGMLMEPLVVPLLVSPALVSWVHLLPGI